MFFSSEKDTSHIQLAIPELTSKNYDKMLENAIVIFQQYSPIHLKLIRV